MAAYLDTNAFDHLYKKIGCTAADIANLRKKIYGRELSILMSIHTLEEILLDQRARPELTVARIKLTLSLGNFRRMVKPCDQLLTDDIRAYAATGEAARPFIDADLQNILSDGIGELIETDGEELDEEMIAVLVKTRTQKAQFLSRMSNHELKVSLPEGIAFDQSLELMAPVVARSFAERADALQGCEQHGIEGLLKIPSVRIAASAVVSLGFGQTFEGWPPTTGASRELPHAVSAAAVAETFVTDDAHLREIVARVPLDKFEVIGLSAFLSSL